MKNAASLVLFFLSAVLTPVFAPAAAAPESYPIRSLNGTPAPDGALPEITGAKEFTVAAPQNAGDTVLNAADFGVSPDAADNTASLQKAIDAARAAGAATLLLPHGNYRFTAENFLLFEKLEDFIFDGQGSTLIFHKPRRETPNALLNLIQCKRSELRNFNIDWDWERDPLASLVEVTAVAADRSSVDLRFVDYECFPQRETEIKLLDMMRPDAVAGMGVGSIWFTPNGTKEWLSDNVLRIAAGTFNQGRIPDGVVPGQYYRASHYYYNVTGVAMSGNSDLTLRNINMYSCPGIAFHAYDEQHHWQMIGVNIVRPHGSPRPITCTADGVHLTKTRGFFRMENCEISFGTDDCFNVNDQSRTGLRRSDRELAVQNLSGTFRVGDPVEFRNADYSPTGIKAVISGIRPGNDNTTIMEFDQTIPGNNEERLILYNLATASDNVIIRNSYFHENRAHSLRLYADDITIENCRFYNNPMGIAITTGYTFGSWCEGYGARNIVLRNNIFSEQNHHSHPDRGIPTIFIGVFLGTDPSEEISDYPVMNHILIENNRFVNNPGALAYISSAAQVVIRDNLILRPSAGMPAFPYCGDLIAAHANEVFITGNTWMATQPGARPELRAEPGTTSKIFCWDNQIATGKIIP